MSLSEATQNKFKSKRQCRSCKHDSGHGCRVMEELWSGDSDD